MSKSNNEVYIPLSDTNIVNLAVREDSSPEIATHANTVKNMFKMFVSRLKTIVVTRPNVGAGLQ